MRVACGARSAACDERTSTARPGFPGARLFCVASHSLLLFLLRASHPGLGLFLVRARYGLAFALDPQPWFLSCVSRNFLESSHKAASLQVNRAHSAHRAPQVSRVSYTMPRSLVLCLRHTRFNGHCYSCCAWSCKVEEPSKIPNCFIHLLLSG